MTQLRPRQLSGLSLVKKAFNEGMCRVMYVGPPGTGKGTEIAYLMHRYYQAGLTAVFIIHKKDLVEQQAARIAEQFGDDVGYYSSGVKQVNKPLMVGTVQTMINRDLPKFDLVLIDEGHRTTTKQHQRVLEMVFKKHLILLTATPFRGDKKGFDSVADILIQRSRYQEEVGDRFLVPTRVIAPKISPSSDGIHLKPTQGGKDFDNDEQFKRYDEERIYRGVVEKWLELAGDLKTIVFTVNSKEHLRKTCEWFRAYGIDARYIDSDTPSNERRETLAAFKRSEFPVLCNIAIFSEGLSIDDVQCIVANFMTIILTKWVQSMTRGSRPVWNEDYSDWLKVNGRYYKEECLILDFGGNCQRLGYVDDYDTDGFHLIPPPKRKMPMPTKVCPECDLVIRATLMKCECGHIFPVKEKEKSYLDEVEMQVVDRAKALVMSYQKKKDRSYAEIVRSLTPSNALIIKKCCGYGKGWPVHALIKKASEAQFPWSDHVKQWGTHPNIKWSMANAYLEAALDASGMREVYESIKIFEEEQ